MEKNHSMAAIENVMLLDLDDAEIAACELGFEPHDYQVEDFSPEQADLVCRKCGKRKNQ